MIKKKKVVPSEASVSQSDVMLAKLYKELALLASGAYHLREIITKYIVEDKMPNAWNTATVVPLLKKEYKQV